MRSVNAVLSLALLLLCAVFAASQNATDKDPKEELAKLETEAVVFLRETMSDVNNLRLLENRISFSAEIAAMMWFHDEQEARSMYHSTFLGFRDLMMHYDMQMSAFGNAEDDNQYRGGMFAEVSEIGKFQQKFRAAMSVRQQVAMSLAEHDPHLALNFFDESVQVLANPKLREKADSNGDHFRIELIKQIAETNVAAAVDFAKRSMEKGLTYQHIDLLSRIHKKDQEKGAEFAVAILDRMKKSGTAREGLWVTGEFMSMTDLAFEASRKDPKKMPMLDQHQLKELADLIAQKLLAIDTENDSGEGMSALQYMDRIEKYSPSRGTQLRARFRMADPKRGSNSGAVYTEAVGSGSNSASNAKSRRELEEERVREKEKELEGTVKKLVSKELPKEEREKIVEDVRKIIVQVPGRDKKVMALSALAAQVSKFGDKELSVEIMKEAHGLVNPYPKTYSDFLLTWMLASGYAEADPEKAFPLIEDTIMRANDTISAFIRVAEFIDLSGEIIDDGELQVGAFGGSMVRGLTNELNIADSTLRTLARADFTKAKALTSRFERSEIRILSKMMILRAVLKVKKKGADSKSDDELIKEVVNGN